MASNRPDLNKSRWQTMRKQARMRDGNRCRNCGATAKLSVHHIVKARNGGRDTLDNLVTLCASCHRRADARPKAANSAVDDLFAKEARVHLLFGDDSPTSIAGAGTTTHLQRMVMALEHRPESLHDHGAMLTYSGNFTGAQEQHLKFNLAALVVLQQTWADGIRERWQLRRRAKL